jgi:metal-responsive CopG/Arc/MetJ family transcriptional regulator
MKVAISIPDPIFRAAEELSHQLRIPRSQFYSHAIEAYVRQHSGADVTAKLNEALAELDMEPDAGWENPGLEVLRREKW